MTLLITEEAIYKKTPQEITSLLYESLLDYLEESIDLIEESQYIKVNEHLKAANDILYRLGAGISYEKGGIIADQLDALYNYMASKVIEANIKKNRTILEEVIGITSELAAAWNQAMKKRSQLAPMIRQRSIAYDQNIMIEKEGLEK